MSDILTGLKARWTCDDPTNGTIVDRSGNGNDLTVTSAGGYPKRNLNDNRQFSQSSDNQVPNNYAQRTLTPSQYNAIVGSGNGNNGEFTVALWYKRTTTNIGKKVLFSIGGVALAAATAVDKQMACCFFDETDTDYDHLRATHEANTVTFDPVGAGWHHVAMVFTTQAGPFQKFALYLDGTLSLLSGTQNPSFAVQGSMPAAASIRIGKFHAATDATQFGQLGGYIHDVRIYARALAAGDIAALAIDDPPVKAPAATANSGGVATLSTAKSNSQSVLSTAKSNSSAVIG